MRRSILPALLVLLALPASAHAGFFPAEVVDGPNPGILSVEDVDISRDGTGGAVYRRIDGGAPHIFFTELRDGAFAPPVRLDGALGGSVTDAGIGVSGEGRMAVAFVMDGSLFTAVKPRGAAGFTGPALLAAGGVTSLSIDMSINGATYVSYSQNGNVHVARAERDSPTFRVIGIPMDINPGQPAGDTERRASQIDVSADGSALVVWGEIGGDGRSHVYARRLFETRPSTAPQDLTVPDVQGVPAGDADSATLDMEDDSSYAQVIFRQDTAGGPRLLMRRLVGSAFEPPVIIDGGLPGDRGDVDLTGRGEGLFAASSAAGQVDAGTIFNNAITGQTRLDPGNAVPPMAQASLGENEDGVVSWIDDGQVLAREFTGVEALRMTGQVAVSNPAFGPVYPEGGLKADSSRAADTANVFLQGGEGDRRLVAGFYDRPPSWRRTGPRRGR